MPAHNPNIKGIEVLSVKEESPAWAKISVAFSVPLMEIDQSSGFVYAQGDFVENPESPSSAIGIHNMKGKIARLWYDSEINFVSKYSEYHDGYRMVKGADIDLAADEKSKFCDSTQSFCIYGRQENGKIVYTIHTISTGWVGFGLGESMANADMFVFWRNGDGYTLSRRSSVSHSLPNINSDKQGISIVELDIPAPAWAKMAVSFVKPIDYETQDDPKYIFALGSSVTDPGSEDSAFNFHYKKGEIFGKDFMSKSKNFESSDRDLASVTQNKFCDFHAKKPGTTNMFCLYGRLVEENILFTIHSSASGWTGIGIGSTMRDADMYVFWKNSTNDGYTVTRRISNGILMPTYNDDFGKISIVPLDVPPPSWSQLSVSFSLPISESLNGKTSYIFAHSNNSVENPDSPKSPFLKHNKKGLITGINFLESNASYTQAGSEDDSDYLHFIIQVHGILMIIAWSVSPFIGIFVARYLKVVLGVWWYRIHVFLMLFVTGIFTLVAFSLIYSYSKVPLSSTGTHGKLGLSIIIIMVLQIISGFICNMLWSADRKSIPWYDKAHWWVGRIVTVLGIVNVGVGIRLYSDMFNEPVELFHTFLISMVLGVGFLIFGQIKFGQVSKFLQI